MKGQLSFQSTNESAIPLEIEESHPIVQLTRAIPWPDLIEVARNRRAELGRKDSGPTTHYRALLGSVIARSFKKVDFRETEDLVRNYLPARYMCDLHNSHWSPDHNTIFDFEQMLGPEGLHHLNVLFLHKAQDLGFLDAKSMCSDTTAQEGKIPYPNEVGLMGSYAGSIKKALGSLGKKVHKVKEKIVKKVEKVKKLVRKHRLFAKNKIERLDLSGKMASLTVEIQKELKEYLESLNPKTLKGHNFVAQKKLSDLSNVMTTLLPQIQHWIDTGWVAKDKIVSLFNPSLRCIKRGKVGKNLEFGLKWGVNQIKGGYVSLFEMPEMMTSDANYAVQSLVHHQETFGEIPKEFGFDRGAWSEAHLQEMSSLGVKRIGVAPKGQAQWLVSPRCRRRIVRERAQVEGRIGTLKRNGMNRPEDKTTDGMKRAARRAELCSNLKKLQKDLFQLHQNNMMAMA